jgi:two-component system response regulator VicR
MDIKNKKILFIEDEPNLIDIYHVTFDSHGYKFFSTPDVEEGMVIAQTEMPNIILLDIILPKKTGDTVDIAAKQGFLFLEKVKKNSKTKDIPVIVFTNLNSSADKAKAKELGAFDYLVKADNLPDEIYRKVESIISKK